MVTSDFHMPRSRAIFELCFSLASRSQLRPAAAVDRYGLEFHAASDEGVFPPDVLLARQLREAKSLEVLKL